MAGFDSTNITGVALQVYSKERLKETIGREHPLLDKIQDDSTAEMVAGQGLYFGVNTSNHSGGRFKAPDAQTPSAGRFDTQKAKVSPRAYETVCEITGYAADLTRGNPGSFVNVMTAQVMDATLSAGRDFEIALFGNNHGKLATVASVAGNVITLSDGFNNFVIGDVIDSINTGGTAVKADMTVVDTDFSAKTITVDDAGSTTAANGLYRSDVQAGTGSFAERSYDGLLSGVSESGTYLDISRTSYPRWKGNVVNAGGVRFDEDVVELALNRLTAELGPSAAKNLIGILSQRQARALRDSAYSRQRFAGNSVNLGVSKIGVSNLSDLIESPFAPETVVYIGDIREFRHFKTPNGQFQISTEFGPAWRFVPNYIKGQLIMRAWDNYCITNPRAWVAVQNLLNTASR